MTDPAVTREATIAEMMETIRRTKVVLSRICRTELERARQRRDTLPNAKAFVSELHEAIEDLLNPLVDARVELQRLEEN